MQAVRSDSRPPGTANVDDRLLALTSRIQELETQVDNVQSAAEEACFLANREYKYNVDLDDPDVRIAEVVVFRDGVIATPEGSLYPRSATEFNNLRRPTTHRQIAMLHHLADFYRIEYDHERMAYGPPISRPDLIVTKLANILGLGGLDPDLRDHH